MNQEFIRHPTIKNYEANRDGLVRHCERKQPVSVVNNAGYLKFYAGGKNYYYHRVVYECFFEEIRKGFVIDHIDGDTKNNSIGNLRVITQRENCLLGNTGKCKIVARKVVKSFNVSTGEEIIFQSIYAAGKYFGICPPSVQKIVEKIYNSAISKNINNIFHFVIISLLIKLREISPLRMCSADRVTSPSLTVISNIC